MRSEKKANWYVVTYIAVFVTFLSIITSCTHNNHSSSTPENWGTTPQTVTEQSTLGYDCTWPDAAGLPQQVSPTAPELAVSRQGDNTQLFVNAGTRPDALITMHGDASGVVVVGDVAAHAVVFAQGNNDCIQIFGSVGDHAVVAVSGTDSQIFVQGSVAPTARLCVEGGDATIKVVGGNVDYDSIRSTNSKFWVQVMGPKGYVTKNAQTVLSCRDLSSKLTITTH